MKTLFIITLMLTFISVSQAFANEACFDVQGMTCATCSLTLKSAVKKLKGIANVNVSVEQKKAVVAFDSKETSVEEIKKVIDDVGYKATAQECKK